jgi:hypothetical protein
MRLIGGAPRCRSYVSATYGKQRQYPRLSAVRVGGKPPKTICFMFSGGRGRRFESSLPDQSNMRASAAPQPTLDRGRGHTLNLHAWPWGQALSGMPDSNFPEVTG